MRYATEKEKEKFNSEIIKLQKKQSQLYSEEVTFDDVFRSIGIKYYSGHTFDNYKIYIVPEKIENKAIFLRDNMINLSLQLTKDSDRKNKMHHMTTTIYKLEIPLIELVDVDDECICYDYTKEFKK